MPLAFAGDRLSVLLYYMAVRERDARPFAAESP